MPLLSPNDVNWNLVTEDVTKAAFAFARSTGIDLSDATFAAWYAVGKAFDRFNPANEKGLPFEAYYRPAIYNAIINDFWRFRVCVSRPRCKTNRDKAKAVTAVDVEEILNLAANDNDDNGFNAEEYPAIALLLAAIDSDVDRHIITARYFGGQTYADIAKELSVSRQTVINREKRALATMRRAGKRSSFDSEPLGV